MREQDTSPGRALLSTMAAFHSSSWASEVSPSSELRIRIIAMQLSSSVHQPAHSLTGVPGQ
ncbi:MAG: hypothetical protein HFI65_04010 [Lachnospiraceae bacterium]|nr:hypothetical protein [Lachnospiraceae bacterium]